jgi:hypothetical protein
VIVRDTRGIVLTMKTKTIPVLLFLAAAPLSVGATGTTESSGKAEPEKTIELFLLAQTGGEAEMYALDRMDLPSSVSLYDWTRFSLKDGEVSTETSRGYGLGSHSVIDRQNLDGFLIIQYRVTVIPRGTSNQTASSSKVVKFTLKECVNSKGVLFQPARLAVIKAVQAAKRSSGYIRITELVSLGDGRFQAIVDLR